MKRPDIKKVMETFAYFSAGVSVYGYYQTINQPKPTEVIQKCTNGFDEMRKLLNEHKEYYQIKKQFQSEIHEKLLANNTRSIENFLNKVKNGETIDTSCSQATADDFKALENLNSILKDLQNEHSAIFKSGSITQEQASLNIGKALEDFNNLGSNKGGPSNSSDLLFNNNLIAEITDYLKAYNDWVSGLNVEQIVYVLNISVLVAVFFSTTTLISIFYSDWLITRFNIEKRFPRIGKILILRKKMQNFSFFINSLIIFVLIIPAFVVNVHALIDSFSN